MNCEELRGSKEHLVTLFPWSQPLSVKSTCVKACLSADRPWGSDWAWGLWSGQWLIHWWTHTLMALFSGGEKWEAWLEKVDHRWLWKNTFVPCSFLSVSWELSSQCPFAMTFPITKDPEIKSTIFAVNPLIKLLSGVFITATKCLTYWPLQWLLQCLY